MLSTLLSSDGLLIASLVLAFLFVLLSIAYIIRLMLELRSMDHNEEPTRAEQPSATEQTASGARAAPFSQDEAKEKDPV